MKLMVTVCLCLVVPALGQVYKTKDGSDVADMNIESTVHQCAYQGHRIADSLHEREDKLGATTISKGGTPDHLHHMNHRASDDVMSESQSSYAFLMATKLLQKELAAKHSMCSNTFHDYLKHNGYMINSIVKKYCEPKRKLKCNGRYPYRSFDGTCNNLNFPYWGAARTPLQRLLVANYADGVYEPAVSKSGKPLPSARLVSQVMYEDVPTAVDKEWTQLGMTFGQFLSHDFSLVLPVQTSGGGIKCCHADGSGVLPPNQLHHACYPIQIPARDPFYSRWTQRCMNFVRSMTTSRGDCSLGPGEQMNSVTSFLDASPIYGNTERAANALRSFRDGRLRVQRDNDRDMLPAATNLTSTCDTSRPQAQCYVTGDLRSNQNPQLTVMHTILMREHNGLAGRLRQVNPHWNDERLFQETRNLLIAILQHITYDEYLPILIDRAYLLENHVVSSRSGYAHDYNETIDPSTLNVFTAAGYRYMHSMINSSPSMVDENRNEFNAIRLSAHYNRPRVVAEKAEHFDGLLRGLATKPMMAVDGSFSYEITRWLFTGRSPYGLDLESLDIQRGRDHGLASYARYREYCGLSKVTSFADLQRFVPAERLEKLRGLYEDVGDIDAFVGAISEFHLNGGQLGPTLRCVFAEQFYRWRVGDRFYYDSATRPNAFTPAQLAAIKRVTIARLMCNNGDNVKMMQPQAFRLISARNPLVPCSGPKIPVINFELWREVPT